MYVACYSICNNSLLHYRDKDPLAGELIAHSKVQRITESVKMGCKCRFHNHNKRLFRMCGESVHFLQAYIFGQFILKSMQQISQRCSNHLQSEVVPRASPPPQTKRQQRKITPQHISFFAQKPLR
ncbi:hypothetical protein ABFS82_03G121000 [Erythranthe guttata]